MKKFISICFCLMLCLTSLLLISGCEEKPKPVSEVQAAEVLETAMINLETSSAIEIECDNFFCFVISEDISYADFMGFKVWTVKEGNYFYDYSIVTYEEEGQDPVTSYIKSLVVEEESDDFDDSFDGTDMLDMLFEGLESSEFSKASLLGDEYSISFKVEEDGVTSTMTFVVEDNILEEIVIYELGVAMTIEFEFGQDALEDIPQRPTNVSWVEYQPHIKVEGMPTEFTVGDNTLDLTNVVIEYYEDTDTQNPDEYTINMSMISGFDTTTAGTKTMTVTFYGLTFDIQYTVTESATE